MAYRMYEVLAVRPVMVDTNNNSILYHKGKRFSADSTNRDIIRLMRINAIREVSEQELRGLGG